MRKALIFFLGMFVVNLSASSQSLPVDNFSQEDLYRLKQLRGDVSPNVSFTIRPLALPQSRFDSLYNVNDSVGARMELLPDEWKILPFTWQNQFNSHHPTGWNDGSMVPAKGLQTFISGGFYQAKGRFSFQIKPELVFAFNPAFEEFPQDHYSVIWKFYYNFYNRTDLPVRFGKNPRVRLYPGQSSVRYNVKKLSAGLSTENLWWGPGMRNSLLMSNTAPGFLHLTVNTCEPVQTPIGSLE
ncbi:MAG: hypothetical protein WBJ10_02950, partial [Daejeonella sp.]